jgi:hypothetical protein
MADGTCTTMGRNRDAAGGWCETKPFRNWVRLYRDGPWFPGRGRLGNVGGGGRESAGVRNEANLGGRACRERSYGTPCSAEKAFYILFTSGAGAASIPSSQFGIVTLLFERN